MNLSGRSEMGYLKEKYTKKYFTGFKKENCDIIYGVTSLRDTNGNLALREQDKSILEKINFTNMKVLEIGFGRGESAVFAIENGASYYEGVDFSESAYELANETTVKLNIKPVFICDDALSYIKNIKKQIENGGKTLFDIIIMLDVVEHIPRSELTEILFLIRHCIGKYSILAINTPAYNCDNDVIKDGYDERNDEGCFDLSETIEETKGMHCNKYTLFSLPHYLEQCGYMNITKRNFYILNNKNVSQARKSYKQTWDSCRSSGCPLKEYKEDNVEYPYTTTETSVFHIRNKFAEDIAIKTTQEYFDLVYKDKEYEIEMFNSFLSINVGQKEPMIIFDVGGFMGITGMLFSKLSAENSKIVIFEPNPYNYDRILENLSLNFYLSKNIEVSNIALSDKNGTINMLLSINIDNGHSSTSRIENSRSKINDTDLPSGFFNIQVKTQTLDNFVKINEVVPDIIKVDIEGAEHFFLLGAVETIRKYKPVIYIEFHSEYCTLNCIYQLLKMGYKIEVLKEENDNRILAKAFYAESGDTFSDLDFIIARQNYYFSNIDNRISEIEKQFTKQNLLNTNKINNNIEELKLLTNRTNVELKQLINENTEELQQLFKNISIFGILRKIKYIFFKKNK
jgi:FkbM family methyltransferase